VKAATIGAGWAGEIGAQVSVTRIRPSSLREVAFVFTHDAG
jgi:hypothetical protein